MLHVSREAEGGVDYPTTRYEVEAVEDTAIDSSIDYNAAVREGKAIVAQQEAGQWRLGELADQVYPAYGENTLAHFAKAIGVNPDTLARYRSVYRAWSGEIPAPGPELSYSVMRELANHPQRAELVRDNPTMTKSEAAKIAREFADEQRQANPQTDEEVWREWQSDLLVLMNRLREDRWVTAPSGSGIHPQVLPALRKVAVVLAELARQLENRPAVALTDREAA